MEVIGLLLFASIFIINGYKHIKSHSVMTGYTASAFGSCPLAKFFGFMGGAPTGGFLVVMGIAAILSQAWAFYALAGFLAITGALFHRNLKDPANLKQVALLGATLALATLV